MRLLPVILIPCFIAMGVHHDHNHDMDDLYGTCRRRVNLLRAHCRAMGLPGIFIPYFITMSVLHGNIHDIYDLLGPK
jgi:hypothetical protein